MQSESLRNFEQLPERVLKKLDDLTPQYRTPEAVKEILRECPRPTLYVGEVIEIKGMSFVVTRIKQDGKLGLKMIPEPAKEKP